MTDAPSQGGLANKQGRILETQVVSLFTSHGLVKVRFRDWTKDPEKYGPEVLVCGVPYTSIYGHKGKTEFLVISARFNLKVRIESKWQQSSGSVDEKFPYVYLNCIQAMPEEHIIILVDGGGAKAEAVNWLRQAARDRLFMDSLSVKKNIQVFDLKEFIIWCNTTLR